MLAVEEMVERVWPGRRAEIEVLGGGITNRNFKVSVDAVKELLDACKALDPELIGEVLNVMKKVASEGMTMLVVTHEMGFAREVADRVVVIDEGEIVEQASPEELFRQPKDPRTRALIERYRSGGH